jgi:hypothetical protein
MAQIAADKPAKQIAAREVFTSSVVAEIHQTYDDIDERARQSGDWVREANTPWYRHCPRALAGRGTLPSPDRDPDVRQQRRARSGGQRRSQLDVMIRRPHRP